MNEKITVDLIKRLKYFASPHQVIPDFNFEMIL